MAAHGDLATPLAGESSAPPMHATDSAQQRQAVARRKLEDPLYYADYLKLDQILSAQSLKSEEAGHPSSHELLFIITHQCYELWFKQILFEIDTVRAAFSVVPMDERAVGLAVQRLTRIREIQTLLIQQMSILETMVRHGRGENNGLRSCQPFPSCPCRHSTPYLAVAAGFS